jgi:hypothetical protein
MASDDNNGSVGGVKDGHAVRRSDGWESPDAFGVMPAGVIGATPRAQTATCRLGRGRRRSTLVAAARSRLACSAAARSAKRASRISRRRNTHMNDPFGPQPAKPVYAGTAWGTGFVHDPARPRETRRTRTLGATRRSARARRRWRSPRPACVASAPGGPKGPNAKGR